MRLVKRNTVWHAVGRIGGHLYRASTGVRVVSGDPPSAEAVERMQAMESSIRQAVFERDLIGPMPTEPRDESEIGFVYFIATHDKSFVKIGWAYEVNQRLKSLQHAHPDQLHLLGSTPGDQGRPGGVAPTLRAHLRHRGEWFRLQPELLAAIPTTDQRSH